MKDRHVALLCSALFQWIAVSHEGTQVFAALASGLCFGWAAGAFITARRED